MSLRDYLPKNWLQVGTKYTEVRIVLFLEMILSLPRHKHVRKHEKAAVAEFMMDFSTNRLEIFQELSATEKSLCLTNIFLLLKKQPNLSWLKTLSTLDPGSCSAARQAEEFCTWFPITSARLIRYPPAFN